MQGKARCGAEQLQGRSFSCDPTSHNQFLAPSYHRRVLQLQTHTSEVIPARIFLIAASAPSSSAPAGAVLPGCLFPPVLITHAGSPRCHPEPMLLDHFESFCVPQLGNPNQFAGATEGKSHQECFCKLNPAHGALPGQVLFAMGYSQAHLPELRRHQILSQSASFSLC